MEPEDEAAFDMTLRELVPRAAWICSRPGPAASATAHLHPTLPEALSCGGTQAFLPLPVGAAPQHAVVLPGVLADTDRPAACVQYLASHHLGAHLGGWFRSGRLAVRWNELDTGPLLHERLTIECRQVWAALRRSTRPVTLASTTGGVIKAQRFGPRALTLGQQPDARLARNNITGMTVVSRHAPAGLRRSGVPYLPTREPNIAEPADHPPGDLPALTE